MRKNIIALAVTLAAFSGVASAATVYDQDGSKLNVYGKADFRHQFTKSGTHNGQDDSYARFGVNGKWKLNDNFNAVGNYEGQANLDTMNGARSVYGTRILNAGIDANQFGAVTVGRHVGAVYNVAGLSDVAPEVLSGNTCAADQGFLSRADSIVQYQGKIGDFTFTDQYQFAKDGRSLENHWHQVNQGAGYGLSVTGANVAGTGIGGGIAYGTNKAAVAGMDDSYAYSVGLNYAANSIYAAATHTAGEKLIGAKTFSDDEVIAQYTFDNGIMPSIGYVNVAKDHAHSEYVEAGAVYAFNKNVSAAVDTGTGVGSTNDYIVKTALTFKF